MKQVIFVILIMLVFVGVSSGQKILHETPFYQSLVIKETGGPSTVDNDSILVVLPSEYAQAKVDTLGDEKISDHANWTSDQKVLWNGYLTFDIEFTNTDLTTDSLEVKAFAIDASGEVIPNHYCWADFGTPPAYSTSQQILDWSDATNYRANFSGAFTYDVFGILFIVDVNDETAHSATATVKIGIN